jgi:hypothetical protein
LGQLGTLISWAEGFGQEQLGFGQEQLGFLSFDFDEYGLTVGLTSLGRLGAHYLRVWPWSRTTQNLTFHFKMNAMAYSV